MAFYQKYRAKKFGEMVGQEHVVGTILASIAGDRMVHAYLLAGPRGIGKTSVARLLAKAVNCEKVAKDRKEGKTDGEPCGKCSACIEIGNGQAIDVIEIDAASHTGVDEIRDVIEKARLSPVRLAKKVYIIDEVHMLSKSAFNALLKTLEEPPSHAIFILATTEIHKIPATIISRVQRYDFRRATKEDLVKNLKRVAAAEKMDVSDEAIELIAILSAGGHRDALGLLEQLSSAKGKIILESAREILGVSSQKEIFDFLGAIFNNNPEEGLKIAHTVYDQGLDLLEFNRGVIDRLRKIMVLSVSDSSLSDETQDSAEQLKEIAKGQKIERLLSLINIFVEAGMMLKDVSYPLLPIEMAVVKSVESIKLKVESANKEEKLIISIPEPKKPEPKIPDQEQTKPELSVPPDSVPVPVLEMTKDLWIRIIDETKKENSTLAALLRDAHPTEVTAEKLILGVKFKFHKDKISETKNMAALEKIVCAVTGSPYNVSCRLVSDKPKATSTDPNEIEKAVGEIFDLSS
ncbi:MAG: DNA polymerase III subunit gamma/tau [Patescibacteria group bacterium]|jgi:DNA polymerase-3 subunit gamma/tau